MKHAPARCALALSLLTAVYAAGCAPKRKHDLSVAQLSQVVVREQPSLDRCYQDALDQQPYDHEFRMEVTLHIKPSGKVAKVELDENGIAGVRACLERTIRSWHFPEANDPTDAKLPLIFRPKIEKKLPDNLPLPPGFKILPPPPQE